jgi:hypothetical protein
MTWVFDEPSHHTLGIKIDDLINTLRLALDLAAAKLK